MMLFFSSGVSRGRAYALGCFALLASFLAAVAARAGERPITDADVERYLPRLRAEAAAFTRDVHQGREASAAMTSAVEEREALLTDMASGKTDIAAWLRAHADQAMIPAGAVYSADCSRAVTGEARTPIAVFTFGKESPDRDLLRRAAAGDEAARDEFHTRRGDEEMGERSAAGQATRDFTAGIVSFYRDHGFVDSAGPIISILTTVLLSPDRYVIVSVSEANYYCGLLPRNVPPACSALPTGPLVELQFQGDMLHLHPQRESSEKDAVKAGTNASAAGQRPAAAEAPAGEEKPDPEYKRVKEALLLARMDAADPSRLDVPIPSDAPPEVKAELGALAAEFAVRKANVAVYKRHEAVLEPILKAFLQMSEE